MATEFHTAEQLFIRNVIIRAVELHLKRRLWIDLKIKFEKRRVIYCSIADPDEILEDIDQRIEWLGKAAETCGEITFTLGE